MPEQLYHRVSCDLCDGSGRLLTANARHECPHCRGIGIAYEPVPPCLTSAHIDKKHHTVHSISTFTEKLKKA